VDTDRDILAQVNELVAEEKELRGRLQNHDIDETEERRRLQSLEVQLDQCWDLLRQRRALRETGQNPNQASVRPGNQVEGYLS
jgi:hypothetical protein